MRRRRSPGAPAPMARSCAGAEDRSPPCLVLPGEGSSLRAARRPPRHAHPPPPAPRPALRCGALAGAPWTPPTAGGRGRSHPAGTSSARPGRGRRRVGRTPVLPSGSKAQSPAPARPARLALLRGAGRSARRLHHAPRPVAWAGSPPRPRPAVRGPGRPSEPPRLTRPHASVPARHMRTRAASVGTGPPDGSGGSRIQGLARTRRERRELRPARRVAGPTPALGRPRSARRDVRGGRSAEGPRSGGNQPGGSR